MLSLHPEYMQVLTLDQYFQNEIIIFFIIIINISGAFWMENKFHWQPKLTL